MMVVVGGCYCCSSKISCSGISIIIRPPSVTVTHVLTVITTRVETPGPILIGRSAVSQGSANHGRSNKEQSQVTFTHLSSRAHSATVTIYIFVSFIHSFPAATYIFFYRQEEAAKGMNERSRLQ